MVAFLPKYRLQVHLQIGSECTKINCLSLAITSIEVKMQQRFNIIRKKQKGVAKDERKNILLVKKNSKTKQTV